MYRKLRSRRKHIAIACIVIACLGFISFHQHESGHRVRTALVEDALIIARPIWQFDHRLVENYFAAVGDTYNYHSLEVVEPDGRPLYTRVMEPAAWPTRLLIDLKLVPLKTLRQPVEFEGKVVGTIIAVWRDTSIYYCAYAVLLSLLLIVIVNLYGNNLDSKLALEEKMRLVEAQVAELRDQKQFIENIFKVVPEGLITIDGQGGEVSSNQAFAGILAEWAQVTGLDLAAVKAVFLTRLTEELAANNRGQYSVIVEGYTFTIEYSSARIPSLAMVERVVSLRDITKLASLERELNQSRKLESVGRLAAGIAHEINTPTQYVFANVDFLGEAFTDMATVMAVITRMKQEGRPPEEKAGAIEAALAEADWDYLEAEVPKAVAQSREGLQRVTSIINAMKNFAHPSGGRVVPANLNSAIENTVTVARNEWKYTSEVQLELAPELPPVPCSLDEFNQVILGMIVNSAHAITQKFGEESGVKGTISISTRVEGDSVVICLQDDGVGMSKGVRERIFDPFFTTKELNKGTGQGLAIAHDVIVNKHKGTITVDSEEGLGTTFTITLPLTVA